MYLKLKNKILFKFVSSDDFFGTIWLQLHSLIHSHAVFCHGIVKLEGVNVVNLEKTTKILVHFFINVLHISETSWPSHEVLVKWLHEMNGSCLVVHDRFTEHSSGGAEVAEVVLISREYRRVWVHLDTHLIGGRVEKETAIWIK